MKHEYILAEYPRPYIKVSANHLRTIIEFQDNNIFLAHFDIPKIASEEDWLKRFGIAEPEIRWIEQSLEKIRKHPRLTVQVNDPGDRITIIRNDNIFCCFSADDAPTIPRVYNIELDPMDSAVYPWVPNKIQVVGEKRVDFLAQIQPFVPIACRYIQLFRETRTARGDLDKVAFLLSGEEF